MNLIKSGLFFTVHIRVAGVVLMYKCTIKWPTKSNYVLYVVLQLEFDFAGILLVHIRHRKSLYDHLESYKALNS